MKKKWIIPVLITGILLTAATGLKGQDISGMWVGSYYFGTVPIPFSKIVLDIKKAEGNGYAIQSHTKRRSDTLVVCEVSCKKINGRNIVLKEIRQISPLHDTGGCFETFRLTLSKDGLTLSGISSSNCAMNKNITFIKMEDEDLQ